MHACISSIDENSTALLDSVLPACPPTLVNEVQRAERDRAVYPTTMYFGPYCDTREGILTATRIHADYSLLDTVLRLKLARVAQSAQLPGTCEGSKRSIDRDACGVMHAWDPISRSY